MTGKVGATNMVILSTNAVIPDGKYQRGAKDARAVRFACRTAKAPFIQ